MTASTVVPAIGGARKAAILLAVLNEDVAAEVFRQLDESDLQRVADEVSNLGPVPVELSVQVFEEYQRMTQHQDYASQGGLDLTRRLLFKALGEVEAQEILQRLTRTSESTPLEMLQSADSQKLARFLEGEHPQTIALVLGQLGQRPASALLMSLPEAKRAEAIKRLSALRKFSSEVAEKVSLLLSQRLKSFGEQGKRTHSGFQSVADIMNSVDSTVAQKILDEIGNVEPSLAVDIRDLMFTFNDLLRVEEIYIRELMGAVDKKTLSVALKGTSEDLKNHFFRTMSSRAVEMLKEDIDSLGPVRGKEVLKAKQDVVALARKLEAEGKMVLKGEGNDEFLI